MRIKFEPDYMGWFGLTWQEKVANYTYNQVKAVDKTIAKKLNDFLQPAGRNIRLIENMYREYVALQAQGYKPANFSGIDPDSNTVKIASIIKGKVNTDDLIILNFLKSLYDLSAAGTIDFSKWNPQGFKESTTLQKSFPSEVSLLEKAGKITTSTAKTGTVLLIVAGIGISLYYLNNIERFKSHGKRT